MLDFQGVGRGMTQSRLNMRIQDLNRPVPPPHTPLLRLDLPPTHQVIPKTDCALLSLAQAIVHDSSVVENLNEAWTSLPGVVDTLGRHVA